MGGKREKRMELRDKICTADFRPVCVCVRMYLNGAQFVLLSRVIVHHHDKIVANVTLFVAAALVALPVWHQCGYVEYSCRNTTSLTEADLIVGKIIKLP